ncbi:hypothetical protein ACHQM5_024419 [Ranunculus cassubicifolius]
MTIFFPNLLSDSVHRRYVYVLLPLFLLMFFSISTITIPLTSLLPIKTLFSISPPITPVSNQLVLNQLKQQKISELNRSKIAVCLVGGARRFELTGPSIIKNILKVYPNSHLFLHSPFDKDSYKFSLLRNSPAKIVMIRIFKPEKMNETESQLRVLTAGGSPNGIQGLLQYFNLVEGCLTMIKAHQVKSNFTYDWIIRSRVDGYWSAPLDPDNFIPGEYLIPPGSNFGGLNDRLGIGDINTSTVALSRLSLIKELDTFRYTSLNSESAFRAQLKTQGVKFRANRLPFCIVSDRRYVYPPTEYGVPVAALSSPGPLSGAKCRPCKPVCVGSCVGDVMHVVYKWAGWTHWENGTLQLCDAHDEWESGWEKLFDQVAGKKFAGFRKQIKSLSLTECIKEYEEMKRRTINWDTPPIKEICKLGLSPK